MSEAMLSVMLCLEGAQSVAGNMAALRAFSGALPPEVPRLVLLCDVQQDSALRLHAEAHGIDYIAADGPCPALNDAVDLLRVQTGSRYGLVLRAEDRLCPAAVPDLLALMAQAGPEDLLLWREAYWLADTDVPMPAPDAARWADLPRQATGADVLGLLPDPRRILSAGPCPDLADPWQAADQAWTRYEAMIPATARVHLLKEPLVLRHLGAAAPAPGFAALASFGAGADQALHRRLDWLGDLLPATGADQVAPLLQAAMNAAAVLPAAALQSAEPGPARDLLLALQDSAAGPVAVQAAAQAQLALLMASHQARRQSVLEQGYANLRRDLDLALPGPDYLADLYARLRGL